MRKTISEMFEDFRKECEGLARQEGQWAAHVSGTKNKKTKFEKLIEQYKKSVDTEIKMDILSDGRKAHKLKTYEVMKKSMEFFQEYGKF